MAILTFLQSLPSPVAQGILWGIMGIGVYITYRILDLADLTVDGSFATGGAVLVMLTIGGMNVYLALFAAFLAGCVAGLCTGLLHTKFGIPPILAGILTQLGLYSVNMRIMTGRSNVTISRRFYDLIVTSATNELGNTILVSSIFVAVLIGILYWFFGTEFGASVRATGCNGKMARAQGINTNVRKVFGLTLSNGVVAMSGGLVAQFQGFADVSMGRGAIVVGLAAVIIGEVVLGKIFKNFALRLLAVVIGGIVYYIVIALVLNFGLHTNDMKLLSALVVAVFLGVPYWKDKIAPKKVKSVQEVGKDA